MYVVAYENKKALGEFKNEEMNDINYKIIAHGSYDDAVRIALQKLDHLRSTYGVKLICLFHRYSRTTL